MTIKRSHKPAHLDSLYTSSNEVTASDDGYDLWPNEWSRDAILFDDAVLYIDSDIEGTRKSFAIIDAAERHFNEITYSYTTSDTINGFRTGIPDGDVNQDNYSEQDAQDELRGILRLAEQRQATDVHVELTADDCLIRFRINRQIHEIYNLGSRGFGDQLTYATYGMCPNKSSNSPNFMQPQYAQMSPGDQDTLSLKTSISTIRVNTMPTAVGNDHGVLMNLRLLRDTEELGSLEDLGYNEAIRQSLTELINEPRGLITVMGPMGQGKSTLLAKLVADQYRKFKKSEAFFSIEDPVEYKLPFPQFSINASYDAAEREAAIRKLFSGALRTDCNRALLPEQRDPTIVNLTLEFALKGHQAWATSHVDGTLDWVPLLFSMDLNQPAIFNPSHIPAAVAQRLYSKLCPDCKIPLNTKLRKNSADLDEYKGLANRLGQIGCDTSAFFVTNYKGCNTCQKSGVVGLVPAAEVLRYDDAIMREYLKLQDTSAHEQFKMKAAVKGILKERGIPTILDDALIHAQNGLIDPCDIERSLSIISPSDIHSFNISSTSRVA